MRITNKGSLFLNAEIETRDKLGSRLSEIYHMRQGRTLYLQAEDEVRFQMVADAIDIARSVTVSSDPSRLTVRLITPQTQAVVTSCEAPFRTGAR